MKLKYIIPVLLAILSMACFEDKTTFDTRDISVISIDTSKLQKEYNIDKNAVRIITPAITQTDPSLPIAYEWQVNYKFYSDSCAFRYSGEILGSYMVRLKVSNQDGSAFYTFKLNVNSPYEEGIAILGEAADGQTELSFMRKFTAEELAAGAVEKFETHCLRTNNPDFQFAKSPSDMAKRINQLFISCKDKPTVYAINTKTFELENVISAPEYPDFIPTKIQVPDNAARTALAHTPSGKVYNLGTFEGLILPNTDLTSNYNRVTWEYFGGYNPSYYLWDNTLKTLCLYSGATPTNLLQEGTFEGHTPFAIFPNIAKDCFTVLSKKEGTAYKTTLGNSFYSYNYDNWPDVIKTFDLREQKTLTGDIPLTPETPQAASPKYKELLYAQGNKIYRWYYSDNNFPTTPWVTIDLPGAEITTLTLSPDEEQLYVGVYQPKESGLNGHLYVLNSDTGKPIGNSPYLNVACKPVKVMYKVK